MINLTINIEKPVGFTRPEVAISIYADEETRIYLQRYPFIYIVGIPSLNELNDGLRYGINKFANVYYCISFGT